VSERTSLDVFVEKFRMYAQQEDVPYLRSLRWQEIVGEILPELGHLYRTVQGLMNCTPSMRSTRTVQPLLQNTVRITFLLFLVAEKVGALEPMKPESSK